jgi:hypothetical protein
MSTLFDLCVSATDLRTDTWCKEDPKVGPDIGLLFLYFFIWLMEVAYGHLCRYRLTQVLKFRWTWCPQHQHGFWLTAKMYTVVVNSPGTLLSTPTRPTTTTPPPSLTRLLQRYNYKRQHQQRSWHQHHLLQHNHHRPTAIDERRYPTQASASLWGYLRRQP